MVKTLEGIVYNLVQVLFKRKNRRALNRTVGSAHYFCFNGEFFSLNSDEMKLFYGENGVLETGESVETFNTDELISLSKQSYQRNK